MFVLKQILFLATDSSLGIRNDLMLNLLSIFREKKIGKNAAQFETFSLQLFRTHCTKNENEVISTTEAESEILYGCGVCETKSPTPSFVVTPSLDELTGFDATDLPTNAGKKFKFDWSVNVEPEFLPDKKTKLLLCRKSFCFLYGVPTNFMKRASNKFKTVKSMEVTSAKTVKNYDHHTYFGDDYSIDDIIQIFDENEVKFAGLKEARAGLVRACDSHIDAMIWMEEYFYRFEHQPNSKHIHLDTTWKRYIWEEYCTAPRGNLAKLSEGTFKTLWTQLFDFVKIRKVKRVTGKCWTCAYINEIRQKQKGSEIAQACKELMIMHRSGFFMLERIEYRRRVAEAIRESPTTTMSTIIDGASQNHCTLPHPGQNAHFTNGLEQHIEGALTHGHGLTIYRSFPTVSADSDFTIYCLLQELRKWAEKNNGTYPNTWYIQIDGGSENANQYLFAAMEYLCIKRVVKRIVLTRSFRVPLIFLFVINFFVSNKVGCLLVTRTRTLMAALGLLLTGSQGK